MGMNNNAFKSLSGLSDAINEKIELIDSGKYGLKELENALLELNELQERLIVLKYKAIEQLATSLSRPTQEKKPEKIFHDHKNPTNSVSSIDSNQMTIMDGIKDVIKEAVPEKTSGKETVTDLPQEGQTSLAEQMESSSISDIRSAIGVNQKFSFKKNLFSNDSDAYDFALDQIDKSDSLQDALKIVQDLRKEYSWDTEDEVVVEFEELLNRRFSA